MDSTNFIFQLKDFLESNVLPFNIPKIKNSCQDKIAYIAPILQNIISKSKQLFDNTGYLKSTYESIRLD